MRFKNFVKEHGVTIFVINSVLLVAEYFTRFVMESQLNMKMDMGFWFSSEDMASLAMQFGVLDNLIQVTFYLLIITTPIALWRISCYPNDTKNINSSE